MAWRRGQAYSQDLRDRVLASEGLTLQQAAERFSVSRSYVSKIRSWLRQSGSAAPRPQKPPVATRLVGLHADIVAHVHAHADLTLAELRAWLADEKAQSARSCDFGQIEERCGNMACGIDQESACS